YINLVPSLVSKKDLHAISRNPSIPALTAKRCCVRATKGTLIPLFIPASTQDTPPDFINKTTSWEVLQLVLVGIAVSYGLFSSKQNDQPKTQDKEDEPDQHAPLSYLSRLLQVSSSVFDDDDDEKQMVENNSKVVERT
ncbi:hypothetical protein Tco_0805145, partial [Tanacetum coccineum]